jgi:hypothetical protein
MTSAAAQHDNTVAACPAGLLLYVGCAESKPINNNNAHNTLLLLPISPSKCCPKPGKQTYPQDKVPRPGLQAIAHARLEAACLHLCF